MFERTVRHLQADHGRSREVAETDAVAIVGADLRNDPRLVPKQTDTLRCFVCGQPEALGACLVPVLTPRSEDPIWLHLDPCHAAYIGQITERAEACLRAAGIIGGKGDAETACR